MRGRSCPSIVRPIARSVPVGHVQQVAETEFDRKLVQSTSIRAISYGERSAILDVEFTTGAIYRYEAVPAHVYARFESAESKGAFFNQEIRPRYRHKRLRGPDLAK